MGQDVPAVHLEHHCHDAMLGESGLVRLTGMLQNLTLSYHFTQGNVEATKIPACNEHASVMPLPM
jgi:hypothetical protein